MRTQLVVIIGTMVVLGATTLAEQAARPEVALQRAIRTETIDGDLRGAIRQYEAIARGGDRGAAAQALLRMADCYQKLGDSQAKNTYERLVRDFPEQTQAVSTARVRLGAPGARSDAVVARQLWTTRNYSEVTITNDGLSAAVAQASPDFEIRNFVTAQTSQHSLRLNPASDSYLEWPVLSPDREQVAYAWAGNETNWNYQLRVSALQPGAKPKSLGSPFPYVFVKGWAPDGKSILVDLLGSGNPSNIGWISVADGTLTTVKLHDGRSSGSSLALSPDGRFIAYDTLIELGKADREIRIIASDASSESVVVPAPGINASPVWSRDGTRLVFKSDRSGTIGIWSVPVRNGLSIGPPTKLKADVGDGALIGFTAAGSLLFEQRSSSRDVFSMELDPLAGTLRGTRTRLIDTFVGSNLNPSSSPDGQYLSYLSQRTQGLPANKAHLVVRSLETGEERVMPMIFQGGGKPLWLPDGRLILLARNAQNHTTIYRIDHRRSQIETLLDTGKPAPQLAALSPDGRTVYFSTGAPGDLLKNQVTAYDLTSGRRTDFTHAGTSRGMAASPDGRSIAFVATEAITPPFRAELHVANADGSNVRTILTSNAPGDYPLNVAWSSDSRFIYFARQGKGSLWRVAAAGGSPTLVGELSTDAVGTIDISPDGRRVIYGAGGPPTIEVWALENLRLPPVAR